MVNWTPEVRQKSSESMYEPILELSNSQKYKPDFWVEEYQAFYEIKGLIWGLAEYEQAVANGYPIVLVTDISVLRRN